MSDSGNARTMSLRFLALVVALGALLAGCAHPSSAPPVPSSIATHAESSDSLLLVTVDAVSAGLTYKDLLLVAGSTSYHLGPQASAALGAFSVNGKSTSDQPVAVGDVWRVPLSGVVDVELRDAHSGVSLQRFSATVYDTTPPGAPSLLLPKQGAIRVPVRAVFQWAPVSDPSGVTYTLQYWVAPFNAKTLVETVPGIKGPTFTLTSPALLPATSYHWRVSAMDAAGNVGAWSDESGFTTSA